MRDLVKYSVSLILLILSVILFFNHNLGEPDLLSNQEIENNYATYVGIDNSDVEHIFGKIDKIPASKIHPVIILTTSACYLCLNNVSEFSDLLKNDSTFADPVLVFLDENDRDVDKFIKLTELDIPYKNISASKFNVHFNNEKQNLIFVDKLEKLIFYNFPIPNAIMLPESKVRIIEQAKEIWK